MFIDRLVVAAVLAGCLMCGAALAGEAAAKHAADLRSGPDASAAVVDQLSENERVNITQCAPSNFCFVEHTGPDGWVDASALRPTNTDGLDQGIVQEGAGNFPNCDFGFVTGQGEPHLAIDCDVTPAAPVAARPAEPAKENVPAPNVPPVLSSGTIALRAMQTVNLDDGRIGGGDADLWYQAPAGGAQFLQPQRGARMALGDGTDRGFKGCWSADFSNAGLALADVPDGSFVCAKTSEGHIAQFGVRDVEDGALTLSYTTWGN